MLELNALIRQEFGKKNRLLREKGFIPAVLYGKKINNLILMVKEGDFEKAYRAGGESTLIKLKIENDKDKSLEQANPAEQGKEERVVLIQDIAKDPVSGKIIHIDFNQVKLDETITVEVPLVFIGESEAVTQANGVLVKNLSSLDVEALPHKLPHEIQVDISVLKTFDDAIRIKDIKIPEGAKIEGNLEDVIATVVPPRTQEELEGLEETPTESVEGVEVEAKGKEKAEEKEGAEAAPATEELAKDKTE